jgi:hypothetical protein
MTIYNHNADAARHAIEVSGQVRDDGGSVDQQALEVAVAQVYATLAIAEAIAKLTSEVRR